MNKTLLTTLFVAAALLLAGCPSAWSYDNYHFLQSGNAAKSKGKHLEAAGFYQDYISSHPFTTGPALQDPALKKRQFAIRNLLKGYKGLLDILRKHDQPDACDYWLDKLMAFYDPELFRSKNRYTVARMLQNNGRIEASIPLYEQIVEDQLNEYWPGNKKVFLRAASKLAAIHTANGDEVKLKIVLAQLNTCPDTDFDNNDKLKRSRMLLQYAKDKTGVTGKLTEIMQADNNAGSKQPPRFTAALKLLKSYNEADDVAEIERVITQLDELKDGITKPGQRYKLAVGYLQAGHQAKALPLLQAIASDKADTIWARKSLFLLGRTALSNEDWDAAILYFSTYIERYPNQTFFCLKAYSKLLDAYWARDGNLDEQDIEINHFADIINQTSDYETQLNLARELEFKGYNQLADTTFVLGQNTAHDKLATLKKPLQKMRVHWQLTKYAYQTGQIEHAQTSGERVIELHEQFISGTPTEKHKKKADHYLSRSYLWLAKAYEDSGNTIGATTTLKKFLAEYPRDVDFEYATIELAQLYEKQKDPASAIPLYESVQKRQWKLKADQVLKRISTP